MIRISSPDPSARLIKPDDLFCEKHFTFEKRCVILFRHQKSHLPVAQLDSASDSDSEGRRFESCRVGHNRGPPPREGGPCYLLFVRFEPAVLLPQRGSNTKLSPSYPFVLSSLSGESLQVAPAARRIRPRNFFAPSCRLLRLYGGVPPSRGALRFCPTPRRPAGRSLSQSLASEKESDATDACLSITLERPLLFGGGSGIINVKKKLRFR